MSDTENWVLEIRLFTVQPGVRPEFDRISREGTIPLMRREGIAVVAFGPSLNDDDGYFLLRAFPSEAERVRQSQAIYALAEWISDFEGPVMSMIDRYRTTVLPAPPQLVTQLTGTT
jgi:hypothetical protein